MNFIKKMSIKRQIWAALIIMLGLTLSISTTFFLTINKINADLNLSKDLHNQIYTAQISIILILIVSAAVGVTIAFFISKQINNLLFDVKDSLQKISDGDFSAQLNENRIGEVGEISALINDFSKKLNFMISDLQSATNDLQHASGELFSITKETSSNISQQHSETEQVATAVEEMSATAQEIARNAASAADSAKQADEQAKSGALISTEAMGGMYHLITDLNNASDVIQKLQAESNNINVVLDVISGISEQTNLLALNAAIEAARAGEQGRGFAVVADEVRTLAGRTQESTDQIKELIDSLQVGSSNAVDAMNGAIEKVNVNNEQVENVAEALGGIAGEIGNINGMLDQMAAASEQQSSTADEISRNVVSISQLAEKTAQGTEHISSAESEIGTVSSRLNNTISSFKT
jgi:methyl-accepting chemotaxis protein